MDLVSFLKEAHGLVLGMHIAGVTLGLGGALLTDIFFFKFLKDHSISEEEAGTMRNISQLIWFALAFLIISGIGLYLPKAEALSQSDKFLMKMTVVLVITLNGALLNFVIAPDLTKISFGEKNDQDATGTRRHRKVAFALGAVSIVSWCTAFTLGMLRKAPFGFNTLLIIYIVLLGGAAIASQFMERSFSKRSGKSLPMI